MGSKIIGTGSYLPSIKITNEALFEKIENFEYDRAALSLSKKGVDVDSLSKAEVFDKWVQQVCGIENRYFATDDIINSEFGVNERMGFLAAEKAIADAGIDKNSIDTIIFATYSPAKLIPNSAIYVAHQLDIKGTQGFTLNTACSGFLDSLGVADAKIKSGQSETVLVIASEYMSGNMNYGDPTTAILFGDGAGAAIVQKTTDKKCIMSYYSEMDFSPENITMDYAGTLKMGGGPNVQKRAVNAMSGALDAALAKTDIKLEDLDLVIPHQANLRIITQLQKKLKLNDEQMVTTIQDMGNLGGATSAIALDKYRQAVVSGYTYNKGETLVGMTVVGGGYTYSSVIMYI